MQALSARGTSVGDTPNDAPISVVIASSHQLVRWALWRIVDEATGMYPVVAVDGATPARQHIAALQPRVAVLDCALPAGAVWGLVRDLRSRHAGLGIVMISNDDSDELVLRALDAGASAYLATGAAVDEVTAAIRHAAVSAATFAAQGLGQALRRRHAVHSRLALSAREREVLLLLRQGLSAPEIAGTLFVSVSTVKTYLGRLYDKLEVANRAQALMRAVELGLFSDTVTDQQLASVSAAR